MRNPIVTRWTNVSPNRDLTLRLHRLLASQFLRKLDGMGVPIKRKLSEVSDDYFMRRAMTDQTDSLSAKELKEFERADNAETCCFHESEGQRAHCADVFGIDLKEFKAKIEKPQQEAFARRAVETYGNLDKKRRQMLEAGMHPHQVAVALDIELQRALDPATDTGSVGVDYLMDAYYPVRNSGKLAPLFPSIDIPPGYKTYQIPILEDCRFVKQAANTTDAYTVNTSEDPANSSRVWTPVKAQATTFWNQEFQEDALYNVVNALTARMKTGADIAMDMVDLRGDTTNTSGANINASGGSLTLGTKDVRLLYNGLLGTFYRGTHGGKSADTFTGGIDGGGNAATIDDVYNLFKDLGKYGIPDEKGSVKLVVPAQVYWSLRDSARAVYGQNIILEDIFKDQIVVMSNSQATHAASSNVPTDALGTMEGYPINLNAAGVFDNATMTLSGAVAFNVKNFLKAWKRHFQLVVVDLNLGEQHAITAGFRCHMQEIVVNEPALSALYNVL